MVFGYARVSTQEQELHLQLDALLAYGCTQLVEEKASAAKERPALNALIKQLRSGDTLVVWKLDRLGRSLKNLVELVTGFQEKQIQFISLQDHGCNSKLRGRIFK